VVRREKAAKGEGACVDVGVYEYVYLLGVYVDVYVA